MKNVDEFHLTIQFLGDGIHEQFLPRITEALRSIDFHPFEIKLGAPRRFSNEDRPNGVWIDCDGGDALRDLADRIRKIMDKIGFRPDKPFAAHITLGRYKVLPYLLDSRLRGNDKGGEDDRKRGGRPQPAPKTEAKAFKVDHFYLMESRLAPEGPTYKMIAEFSA